MMGRSMETERGRLSRNSAPQDYHAHIGETSRTSMAEISVLISLREMFFLSRSERTTLHYWLAGGGRRSGGANPAVSTSTASGVSS